METTCGGSSMSDFECPRCGHCCQSDMPMRDWYAGLAMQGMLANPKLQEQILKAGQSWIEESAYAVADAMLKARER